MKQEKNTRALNLFSGLSAIPDNYVAAAEDELYSIEARLSPPPRSRSAFGRFLCSGWCAAAISGIVALTVLVLLIRMGGGPGVVTPPPVGPSVGTTLPVSPNAAEFTIKTEKLQYEAGTEYITVILTGKTPGESFSDAGYTWYLESLSASGEAREIEIFPAVEAAEGIAADDSSTATAKKLIRIPGGLNDEGLRLHATRKTEDGYESAASCDVELFWVETDQVITDNIHVDFTLSTDRKFYLEGTTSFVVTLTGKNPGQDIYLPGEWHLYRVVDGRRVPVVGMYYTAEELHGIAPDENTCATLHKTIFINPHNSSAGLAAGRYILGAHVKTESGTASVECEFEVIARDGVTDPDCTDTDGHHHEEHHGSATPGDMARVDMFYITDDMAYVPDNRTECENSKVYISLPDLDCHDVVPFHHYITSDGKVYYLPSHHAHK